MAQRRIIGYFMHEDEQQAARETLPDVAVMTEGYFMATADEPQIEKLRQRGVVVQVLEETAERQPLRPRRAGIAFAPPTTDLPTTPTYYVLELDGPVFAEWRETLSSEGVEILEALGPSRYAANINPVQVPAIEKLPFVRGVTTYDLDDTLSPTNTPPRAKRFDTVADSRFEIRLRGREQRKTVLDWLKEKGIAVERQDGRRIRIRVPATQEGDIDALRQVDGVASVTDYVPRYDVLLLKAEDHDDIEKWLYEHKIKVDGSAPKKFRIVVDDDELLTALAASPAVASVEEYIPPDIRNDVARRLLGIDRPNPGAGISLTGHGQIVGVADTGIDDQHPDFSGRLIGKVALGRPGLTSDPDGHGTHVAGSIVGTGQASGGKIRGMAPDAQLFFQSVLDANDGLGGLPLDLHDLFDAAYQKGVRIHNNSWGAAMAGRYSVNAYEIDDFVDHHRDMLIVVAAGNEGQAGKRVHSQTGFVDWLSVGSPASCKNALTVGASRSSRTNGGYATLTYGAAWPSDFPDNPINSEKISGNSDALAGFSSRGPCDDYRIKPDVVAPGTDILSTKSSIAPASHFWGVDPAQPKYAYMGGTSMAAPVVAGCAALVREYYDRVRHHQPSAALLKATLINGAKPLTAKDAMADHSFVPNYHQGFGSVDMTRTVPDAALPPFKLEFLDEADVVLRVTGARQRYKFTAAAGWLRVCIAWTDPEGRAVQNSMALLLEHRPTKQKWIGNPQVPLSLVTPDPTNNVVVIRIDNAPAGDYVLQITAYNLVKPPQNCALVVTGSLQSALAPY